MELTIRRQEELRDKIVFTREVGAVISQHRRNCIEYIDYRVLEDKLDNTLHEFLIITYRGGERAVYNCTGASLSAIFDTISRAFDGGDYQLTEYYDQFKKHCVHVVTA